MDRKKLIEKISAIEKTVEDESLGDGLTIMSAALSHAIALSIESGNFDETKLHDFMLEMERKIKISIRQNAIDNKKIIGIKRAG